MAEKTYSLKAVLSCRDNISEKLAGVRKNIKVLNRSFANVTKAAGEVAAKAALPFTALAGMSFFSIQQAVSNFTALGDSIDKAAIRAGVTTGALQKLRLAARYGGSSAEEMDTAISKLSYQMGQMSSGNNDNLVKMFKELGITWKDSKGKARDAASVMRELADAVQANTDPTKRLTLLSAVFGDDMAAHLVPVLQDGAEGLDAVAKKAEELGIVMSDVDTKRAAKLSDTMTTFREVLGGVANKVGATLAPALITLIEKMQEVIVANKDLIAQWATEFGDSIMKIPFKEIFEGFMTVVDVCKRAFDAIGGVRAVLIAFGTIAGLKVLKDLWGLTGAVVALGKAFFALVGWPGLVAGAAIAAVGAVYTYWDEIKAWFLAVGDKISAVWDDSLEKVRGAWYGFKSYFDPLVKWFEDKLKIFDFKVPDVAKGLFGGGEGTAVPAVPVSGIPSARFSGEPDALQGSVVITVKSADGTTATVNDMNSKGGNLSVETPGSYAFGDL